MTATQTTDADIVKAFEAKADEIAAENGWSIARAQSVMLRYLRDTSPAEAATIAAALRPEADPETTAPGGMNGTGISKGEKVMADYHCTVDGQRTMKTIVLNVEHAWFMEQPNRMYISDGANHRYVVETDSVRIVA